jgi:hypothetical protein
VPTVLSVPNFVLAPWGGGTSTSILPVRLGPNLSLRYGTVLGEYAGRKGVFGPYDPAAIDGREVARCVLRYSCSTDSAGNITIASLVAGHGVLYDRTYSQVDAFMSGSFLCSDLVGLDAAAVGQLGRLIEGTVTEGLLRVT